MCFGGEGEGETKLARRRLVLCFLGEGVGDIELARGELVLCFLTERVLCLFGGGAANGPEVPANGIIQ